MAEQPIVTCKVVMVALAVTMVTMATHLAILALEDHMAVELEDQHIIRILQLQENMEVVVQFELFGQVIPAHFPQLTLRSNLKNNLL
jgi:hypothetical protein